MKHQRATLTLALVAVLLGVARLAAAVDAPALRLSGPVELYREAAPADSSVVDIAALPATAWRSVPGRQLGYVEGAIWLRAEVRVPATVQDRLYLRVAHWRMEQVHLYRWNAANGVWVPLEKAHVGAERFPNVAVLPAAGPGAIPIMVRLAGSASIPTTIQPLTNDDFLGEHTARHLVLFSTLAVTVLLSIAILLCAYVMGLPFLAWGALSLLGVGVYTALYWGYHPLTEVAAFLGASSRVFTLLFLLEACFILAFLKSVLREELACGLSTFPLSRAGSFPLLLVASLELLIPGSVALEDVLKLMAVYAIWTGVALVRAAALGIGSARVLALIAVCLVPVLIAINLETRGLLDLAWHHQLRIGFVCMLLLAMTVILGNLFYGLRVLTIAEAGGRGTVGRGRLRSRLHEAMAMEVAGTDSRAVDTPRLPSDERQQRLMDALYHDLKIPLTTIVGSSELMLSGRKQVPLRQVLEMQLRAGSYTIDLLRDYELYRSLDQGELKRQRSCFSIAWLGEELKPMLDFAAREKDVKLSWEVSNGSAPLLGARHAVGRILTNIVSNAIEASAAAGGEVRVMLTVSQSMSGEGAILRVQVDDSGPGIGDATLRAMVAGDLPGTGMKIVKRLISEVGGRFSASSTPGTGTSITFSVPVELGAPPEPAQPSLRRPARGPKTRRLLSGLRVLVLEDCYENRVVVKLMLQSLGCSVACCQTVREAGELFKARVFDAVITDMNLPDGTGLDLVTTCRAAGAACFLMTAEPGAEAILAKGFSSLIEKPVRMDALHRALVSVRARQAEPPNEHGFNDCPMTAEMPCANPSPGPDLPGTSAIRDRGLDHLVQAGFMRTFEETLAALRVALRRSDYERVAGLAHRLLGSALTASREEIVLLARRLEVYARRGSSFDADAVLEELTTRYAAISGNVEQQQSS